MLSFSLFAQNFILERNETLQILLGLPPLSSELMLLNCPSNPVSAEEGASPSRFSYSDGVCKGHKQCVIMFPGLQILQISGWTHLCVICLFLPSLVLVLQPLSR